MEFDFTSSTLAKLSTPLQTEKYRQLAEQAEKSGFLSIAKQWRTLAEETERQKSSRVSSPREWQIGNKAKRAGDAARAAFGKRSSPPARLVAVDGDKRTPPTQRDR